MGRVWLICCRTISWLLSGLFLLCPGSVPPSRSRSLPTQSHTGQQQVHSHFKQKLQLIITAVSAHEDGWRTNPSYSDKVSTMCQVICEPRMVKINNTTAPRESAQNVWSCASSDVNKVQLRCQAESVYLTARFNKISTYSSAILEKKPPRLWVSFVPRSVSLFWGPRGWKCSTDSAASHILPLPLLSGPTSLSSQWQVSNSSPPQTHTRTRETFPKSCSDNMILSRSSSSSCLLYLYLLLLHTDEAIN